MPTPLPPGLAGFVAGQQETDRSNMAQLQQRRSLLDLMSAAEKQQREKQFRGEVAGLGDAPTQESLAQLAAKYAGPDALLGRATASADRQAATTARTEEAAARRQQGATDAAARRDQQQQFIDFRYDQLAQNATDAEARRKIEERRAADKAQADKQHDETLRLLGATRADAAKEKAPPGYRYTADKTLEAIPGGPADTKLQGQFNADTATLQGSTAALDRLGNQVNIVKNSNLGGITGVRGMIKNIPGTASADAQARLESLKYQIGFSVLQELKNQSKTGASGLGSITEKEHVLLQNLLGSLERAQSEGEIRRVLDDMSKYVDASKGRIANAYNLKHKDRLGSPTEAPGAPQPTPGSQLTPAEQQELEALRARLKPNGG